MLMPSVGLHKLTWKHKLTPAVLPDVMKLIAAVVPIEAISCSHCTCLTFQISDALRNWQQIALHSHSNGTPIPWWTPAKNAPGCEG